MTEKNNNLTIIKKENVLGNDFTIYGDIDNPLFLAKDVAEMIEHSNPRMMLKSVDEDEKVCVNNPYALKGQQNQWFLTEYGLYEVLMQSRKPIAKEFKSRVKEILRDLRRTGCVITESATTESIDYQKKYGKYRIRKTFTNTKDPRAEYEQFIELSKLERKAKRINNEERIKCCNIIIDTLQTRIADEMLTMRPSELLAIQELVVDIQNDVIKLSNRKNGGKLAAKTKKLNELQDEYDELYELYRMEDANYYLIPRHGFTTNCAYTYDENSGRFVKSKAYQKWISNLNLSDFLPSMYPDINYDKPLRINLGFVCKDEFDVHNLTKTIIDQIANFYEFNDNQIIEARQKKIDNCNNFSDGRIYVKLENVDDID